MDITTLFIIMFTCGTVSMIAAVRNHWNEFSVFIILTVFSTMGFAFRLLG